MSELIHTQHDLDEWRARARGTVAFVPTMGALHEGHLALVRRARELADHVVVSIFVNPRQFGANEDFDKYPRTLDADVTALGDLADVVFAPEAPEVYPVNADGTSGVPEFFAGPAGATFEGAARPGHFDGMLTVVARLFTMVQPDVAIFGQKDAQQVFLVRRLIRDHFPYISFEVVPTMREKDGLAMSSRNRFLSPEQRVSARHISRAMQIVDDPTVSHRLDWAGDAARRHLATAPEIDVDYLEAVDPSTFTPVRSFAELDVADNPDGHVTWVIAARVGTTRLLDTVDVVRQ